MFTRYKLLEIECKYENRWEREMRDGEAKMMKSRISTGANKGVGESELRRNVSEGGGATARGGGKGDRVRKDQLKGQRNGQLGTEIKHEWH